MPKFKKNISPFRMKKSPYKEGYWDKQRKKVSRMQDRWNFALSDDQKKTDFSDKPVSSDIGTTRVGSQLFKKSTMKNYKKGYYGA